MQVKSIAECSKGSILQYVRPSISYHLSLIYYLLLLNGRLRQVLLYFSIIEWLLKTGLVYVSIIEWPLKTGLL